MQRNARSTHRLLPGLAQALSWLRQGLPPAERTKFALIPAVVPARTLRQRRIAACVGDRHHRDDCHPN